MKIAMVLAMTVGTLVACGGGGSSTDSTQASATDNNTFKSMLATYSSGCTIFGTDSSIGTLILSELVGADKVTGSFQEQYYKGSTTCATANIAQDITLTGQLTTLAATKAIVGTTINPKKGIASEATFTLTGVKMSKGSFSGSFPTLGTSTTVGYMLEGNKLYGVIGSKDSDGMGNRFSNSVFIKQ